MQVFVQLILSMLVVMGLACGEDAAAMPTRRQQLYEQTRVEAEVACLGRAVRDPAEYIALDSKVQLCMTLLTWDFLTDCEAEAFDRYPDYQELMIACLEQTHEELLRCCRNGGPLGRASTLCSVALIDACASEMNSRPYFCPQLPEFVSSGLAREALECAMDDGFDSLGGGLLPPVCGAPTVCIADHSSSL